MTVLMPNRRGQPAPVVEKVGATSARITLGTEAKVVHLGDAKAHLAAVERNGEVTVVLPAGTAKPWTELELNSIPPDLDRGGR